MAVSLRYPPVVGRLHTRYAPVRRSPAQYCYRLLPLDLHVLSLPLAFILSQDQTLHCKNCSFTFLTRLRVSHIYSICMSTHAISFFSSVSNYSVLLWRKTGAKVQPFFIPTKYFFKIISFSHLSSMNNSVLHIKIFFTTTAKQRCKTPFNTLFLHKNRPLSDKNGQKEGDIYAIN